MKVAGGGQGGVQAEAQVIIDGDILLPFVFIDRAHIGNIKEGRVAGNLHARVDGGAAGEKGEVGLAGGGGQDEFAGGFAVTEGAGVGGASGKTHCNSPPAAGRTSPNRSRP